MGSMTTKLASRTDPADLALATECIAWHVVHCAMCITGEVCGAAAENLAFLEGTDLYEVTAAALPAPRTPSAGAGGATSRRANPASDKQTAFLDRLLDERDVAGVTDLQNSVLAHGLRSRRDGNLTSRQASDMIDILVQCPMRTTATPTDGGPSEAQVRFFTKLLAERDLGVTLEWFRALPTRKLASEAIDSALTRPRREVTPEAELTAGIYQVGELVYKVQRAVHGSGKMVAKLLEVSEFGSASFAYQGLATRFIPAGTEPMTLDQAKAFGALYGVCCNCGRTLTDEGSIEAGIGPVCAKKFTR